MEQAIKAPYGSKGQDSEAKRNHVGGELGLATIPDSSWMER